MATTWFIGSVVADVIIRIDHLPRRQEDLSVLAQTMQLGGCAYNASDCFRHLDSSYHLLCPVGTGLYGDFVRTSLKKRGIEILISTKEANGCCYCFVEKDGERTFLANHGAEYFFSQEILQTFKINQEDSVYISGLEIEESTGQVIIDYLKLIKPQQILFAPGPRLMHISKEKWEAILALHPILHLNQEEACLVTGFNQVEKAAQALWQKTHAPVIITCGPSGAYGKDATQQVFVPAKKVEHLRDTIGAGDNHAGMCLYGFRQHWPLTKILEKANQYSAAVVSIEGGQLSDWQFEQLLGKEKFK